MAFKVDVGPEGRRTFARVEVIGEGTRRALSQAFFQLGKDLMAEANREILRGIKTGRIYVRRDRSGRRRRHRASAPGETHANLTGTLRRSLSWKQTSHRGGDFGYGIAGRDAAPPYAPAIELGRRDGSIAPRPTLRNAIDANLRNLETHFVDAMDREFK